MKLGILNLSRYTISFITSPETVPSSSTIVSQSPVSSAEDESLTLYVKAELFSSSSDDTTQVLYVVVSTWTGINEAGVPTPNGDMT